MILAAVQNPALQKKTLVALRARQKALQIMAGWVIQQHGFRLVQQKTAQENRAQLYAQITNL